MFTVVLSPQSGILHRVNHPSHLYVSREVLAMAKGKTAFKHENNLTASMTPQEQDEKQEEDAIYCNNADAPESSSPRADDADGSIDDILIGLMFAFLSVTDNRKNTLKKLGKTMPWHVHALTMITGSEEKAHWPLIQILNDCMGFELDCYIDKTKVTRGGHFLDTKGFIAHSDDAIVLSYRCSISVFDWLTNVDLTSSVWDVDKHHKIGFSGICSGAQGLCCGPQRPRVHTGFYNSFLASLPLIKAHIEPLLGPDQPPRKLFVTGHSLGAGIAMLATCYLLLNYEWTDLPQSLCSVTAGSPRCCGQLMCNLVESRLQSFGFSKKVRIYRVVNDNDIICKVPPKSLGFRHFVKPVFLGNGKVNWHKASSTLTEPDQASIRELVKHLPPELSSEHEYYFEDECDDNPGRPKSLLNSKISYHSIIAKVASPIRNHMPDHYMKPVLQACGVQFGCIIMQKN